MQPEHSGPRQVSLDLVAPLTDTLFDLAGDQDVRVIEALAAVLARQWRDEPGGRLCGLCEAPAPLFASEPADADSVTRRAICQRIARRALHGSLVDPTRGATAFHRIDDSPTWSRDLLPTGMFGSFLFYRPASRRWRATSWPPHAIPSLEHVSGL